MKSSINYNSAADLINSVYSNIDENQLEQTTTVINYWKKIISSIKPDGLKLAAHSRIIDLKNHVLLIETDHPGWTQLLQMRQKYILNGLKMKFPELKINTLGFKLKSDNFTYQGELRKPTFESMENVLDKRLEKEDKYLKNNREINNNKEKESEIQKIDPELQKRLNKLRDSILTNS